MQIAYFAPLNLAWERMKHILWRPFDLSKWIVLGFSAWLAGLADGSGGGGWKWVMDNDEFSNGPTFGSHGNSWEGASDLLLWLPLLFVVIMAVAAILLVILWVSSRSKFIFLDNVVHNRAEIVEPWHRLRDIGNSLFLWRLGFVVVCGLVAMILILLFLAPAATFSFSDALAGLSYAAMILGVLVMIVFGVAAAFVALMLEGFVIPIMYKFEIKATEAWRYFLPWLKTRPLPFFLYALFVLGLGICFMVFFSLICVLTCCVVALPFVGTVIMLPIWVAYRLFSVEFLAQFDPGFDLFTPGLIDAETD